MRSIILGRVDFMIDQFFARLDGMSDDEHLWDPVGGTADVWSVRPQAQGDPRGTVDGVGDRDRVPAPVPTIAWRMWHLGVDCFETYCARFAGVDQPVDTTWPLDAETSIESVRQGWQRYRTTVDGFDDWFAELGPRWGPFATSTIADMVEHCGNEIVHHAAEIALLRDLYRARTIGA